MAKAVFQTAEKWLRDLNKWKAKIIVAEEQLTDHSGKVTTKFSAAPTFSGTGDGTYAMAETMLQTEAELPLLVSKQRMTEAAIESLTELQQQLVYYKYFVQYEDPTIFESMLHISRSSFYRERQEAVLQVANILSGDWQFRNDIDKRYVRLVEIVKREEKERLAKEDGKAT